MVRDRDGDHTILDPPRPGHLLQVPWESPIGVGRKLSSSGPKPLAGTTEVGVAVQGVDQGGCG